MHTPDGQIHPGGASRIRDARAVVGPWATTRRFARPRGGVWSAASSDRRCDSVVCGSCDAATATRSLDPPSRPAACRCRTRGRPGREHPRAPRPRPASVREHAARDPVRRRSPHPSERRPGRRSARPPSRPSSPCRTWYCRSPPPFWAGAKAQSSARSEVSSDPASARSASTTRHAPSPTSSPVHATGRRQQVAGGGKWSGTSRHRRPLRSTKAMASKQARSSARGRPPFGLGRYGGSGGATRSPRRSLSSRSRATLGRTDLLSAASVLNERELRQSGC
jgi:hypothetical protein